MNESSPTTQPPSDADEAALEYARKVGEHDRELRARGASSSGLFRALALAELAIYGE